MSAIRIIGSTGLLLTASLAFLDLAPSPYLAWHAPRRTSAPAVAQGNPQLRRDAALTWRYFVDATANATSLPADRIDMGTSAGKSISATTSPTDIAMYLMSLTAARDLGLVSPKAANQRMKAITATLVKLPNWHGFPYNWYNTSTGSPQNTTSGHFISTVDDGWYAAGLIVARQAFPQFAAPLTRLVNAMDFARLYDPSAGQLYGGYDTVNKTLTTWHYGNLNTESRVADYIAIGSGKVPATLWWSVYRTLPASWTWQLQKPVGQTVTHDGVPVFEGHYSMFGMKYVPSWGGSMFETLMPTIVLEEQTLAPNGLGMNDRQMVDLQMRYAASRHYPVWGISPCALPNNGYGVYGVPGLGASKYAENGTVTPYATFLALNFRPRASVANLARLQSLYHLVGPLGYYDSVNVHSGAVAHAYLALDEGMSLAALDNYLNHDSIQHYFNANPVGRKPQSLLSRENMFLHS